MKRTMSKEEKEWVVAVNKLAKEMDEQAASIHPATWPETMKAQNDRFKKTAAAIRKGGRRK